MSKNRKEKLEDINIMQGIDFKGNRVKRQIERTNYKKKYIVLVINKKKLAQLIVITLLTVAFIYGVIKIVKVTKQYNDEMQARCEVNHSRKYCLAKL